MTAAGVSLSDQAVWMEVCGLLPEDQVHQLAELLTDQAHVAFLSANLQAKYKAFNEGDGGAFESILMETEQYLTKMNKE